jgi:hypothetical protein
MGKLQKGHKLSPGRPKGSQNKRTLEIQEIANRVGVNPLEILLKIAAGDWKGLGYVNEVYIKETAEGEQTMGYTITPEMRLNAAKEASQYLYSKKRPEEPVEDEVIEVYSLEQIEEAELELQKIKQGLKKLPESNG